VVLRLRRSRSAQEPDQRRRIPEPLKNGITRRADAKALLQRVWSYTGSFVVGATVWGWFVDGGRLDRFDPLTPRSSCSLS